jgi:hypothetical protein
MYWKTLPSAVRTRRPKVTVRVPDDVVKWYSSFAALAKVLRMPAPASFVGETAA